MTQLILPTKQRKFKPNIFSRVSDFPTDWFALFQNHTDLQTKINSKINLSHNLQIRYFHFRQYIKISSDQPDTIADYLWSAAHIFLNLHAISWITELDHVKKEKDEVKIKLFPLRLSGALKKHLDKILS